MRARLGAGYDAWWAAYRADLAARDAALTRAATASGARSPATAPLVIPLVIHVLYDNGGGNIPDEQVYDAVRILNEDFQKRNPDTAAVIPPFRSRIGNTGVEFRLARLDPSGRCTNGITRTFTPLANNADDNVRSLVIWDVNRYLNVWVVKSMGGGAAGYAYLPCDGGSEDGINILNGYLGSIGSSSPRNSRVFTHEVGHYLGLPHTWGGTNNPGPGMGNCSDDDGIADTPNTEGSVAGACNLALRSCPGSPDALSNVQNQMDYSYCSAMFTTGQAALMHNGVSANGFSCRRTLSTGTNLRITGVATGQIIPPCAPVAMLDAAGATPTGLRLCAGEVATFRASAGNLPFGAVATFQWRFPGGQPTTSTDGAPVVRYPMPGTYPVVLTVRSNGLADSVVRPTFVRVGTITDGLTAPLAFAFDDPAFPLDPAEPLRNWEIATTSTTNTTWEATTAAAATGPGAVRVRLRPSGNESVHTLVSPNIIVGTAIPQARLRFRVAYAQTNATNADQLELSFSTNCGQTWTRRLIRSGTMLARGTTPVRTGTYVPAAADWYEISAYLGALNLGDHLLIRFQATADGGNALYLDALTLNGQPLGLTAETATTDAALTVIPNPTSSGGAAVLQLTLPAATTATLRLYDATGRLVRAPLVLPARPAGTREIPLAAIGGTLAPGLYLIDLTLTDGTRRTVRMVVE